MDKNNYSKYAESKSPKSKFFINIFNAFVIGGLICTIGQSLTKMYENTGLDKDGVSAATSITLILAAAILTGFDIYDGIAKYAGAGTIVPITGFSNAITSPAIEYKSEGLIMGIGAKMFVIVGPVLVYGIGSSIILGLIYYIFQ